MSLSSRPGLCLVAVAAIVGCDAQVEPAGDGAPPVRVQVTPPSSTVPVEGSVQLQAAVTGTPNLAVTWAVVEPVGAGTVSQSGLYRAPSSTGTFHVRARSVADASVFGDAAVTVAPLCTAFTYGNWGTCSPEGQQTRTVVSSSPAGCVGGAPVLSQACTPVCTTFTYSAWSACTGGQQTRTVLSSAPSGCSGGAPELSRSCSAGPLPAFPGAQGFGAVATGGRGGRVIKVTNLNASGPGSLQAALDVNQPRIIVFAVSGVIQGDVTVTWGNVTIAGQTAPGAGITIAGRLDATWDLAPQYGNIVIRHLRVRTPRCSSSCNLFDAIQLARNGPLILDHVSVAFGADETVDIYETDDVTIQWSAIEISQEAPHPDGYTHNYGVIQGPGTRLSFHHNLVAHHRRRGPAVSVGPAEVSNNVYYNMRHPILHNNPASGAFNLVGNYFKQGPNDSLLPFFFDDEDASLTSYYLRDSYVDDPGQLVGSVDNPWSNPYFSTLAQPESRRSVTEFDFGQDHPVTLESALSAYGSVLARAGAWPRDLLSQQTVTETLNRTGRWDDVNSSDGGSPFVMPSLTGGLTPGAPPVDTDGDGMPDAWETAHGLDPGTADHATVMPSGYTAIEEYVNGLADALLPP